jgi:hypothetical protein
MPERNPGCGQGRVLVKIKLHSKMQALNTILRVFEISEIQQRLTEIEEQLKIEVN